MTKKIDFLKNTEIRPVLQKIENDKDLFLGIGDIQRVWKPREEMMRVCFMIDR